MSAPPNPKNERHIIHGLRWWIAGFIFAATLVNFLDRLTVSVLAPVITVQLGLSNLQFATINNFFLVAYATSQALSGKLYDRVGVRRGFMISIIVWSAAAIAHAFARGMASLSAMRFVLGLGEAGNWPGAAKVIAEWFPVRQRALGMGIFNSAVALGSVVAPPLIVWLQLRFGWRAVFLFTGSLGFAWLLAWAWFYQDPEKHASLSAEEYQLIRQDRPPGATRNVSWSEVVKHRPLWGIVLCRFVTDPIWWFYVIWLPLYLFNARGFSLKQIGAFAWLPYVAAGAGSLGGGWASGFLINRGWSVDRARKSVMVFCAALMCVGVLISRMETAGGALALMAIVLFGFQGWINNVQTLPSDYFPQGAVGSVAGLGGLGAGIGAILFTWSTGYVVDHFHSYSLILTVAGCLPIVGVIVLFALAGPIRRLTMTS